MFFSGSNSFIIINKMLSINGTFLLLSNQSLSIENIEVSCAINRKIWFVNHFIVSCLIESVLYINILAPLCLIIILFFNRHWNRINDIVETNRLNTYESEEMYSYIIDVLKKEIKLIFVYVYVAFLYTWLGLVKRNYRITYVNFLEWSIEASVAPLILLGILFFYYIEFILIQNFDLYRSTYVYMVILKVPLFFLMRYREIHFDFFLNRFERTLFNQPCYLSWK